MREILAIIRTLVFCLWPMSAFAAGETLGGALYSHSLADWIAVLMLSTVSGLVAFLNRVKKHLEADALERAGKDFIQADKMLLDWRVFAGLHMSCSYLAGLLAFFVSEHLEFSNYMEALSIALAAWAGAKLIDMFADAGLNRVATLLGSANAKRGGADTGP